MKKFARGCLIGSLCLFVVIAVLTVCLHVLRRTVAPWPEPVSGVRLEPTRPVLRAADIKEDNAFALLRQLPSAYTNLSDEQNREFMKYNGWKENAYPELEQCLKANDKALLLCRQAAAMTNCQIETADSLSSLLPYLAPMRQIVRVLRIRAEAAASRGDWDAAVDDYRTALLASDHLTRGGSLINHLVDFACAGIVCQSMRRMALESNAPPEALGKMIRLLEDIDGKQESFAEPMRYERLMGQACVKMVWHQGSWLQTLVAVNSGEFPSETSPLWNVPMKTGMLLVGSTPKRMSAHMDAVYSRLIDIASGPYSPARFEKEIMSFINVSRGRGLLGDDPVGRILVAILVPALDKAHSRYTGHVANMRGTSAFLAICLYRKDHNGELPAALDDLCPGYLQRVPVDPFAKDGAGLRFWASNGAWTVYSVGPNQTDDGGRHDWTGPERDTRTNELDVCFFSDEFDRRKGEYLENATDKR